MKINGGSSSLTVQDIDSLANSIPLEGCTLAWDSNYPYINWMINGLESRGIDCFYSHTYRGIAYFTVLPRS